MVAGAAVVPASLAWLWAQVSCCWRSPSTLALSLVALALLLDYAKRRNRWSHRPPGPAPLPFIGHLALFDRKKPHEFCTNMGKKFGPMCLFQAGWTDIILLSGFKTIKEALGQKAESFADRPPVPMLRVAGRAPRCAGIIMARCSDGWREQRRFCLKTLKNFGMGKKTLAVRVSEEARHLCSELKSKDGSLFDPRNSIFRAVGNIICALTFGERFKYTDKTFLKLMHLVEEVMGGLTKIMAQVCSKV
ncbi:cytochrome P450 2D14-like [Varanus komodoensis]|uniref:cytochrome P450 2D14-like n=1 Tax=Varanus komodoensis TaxID=61221 RepID=UPI001CF7B1D7|nr:cytochrome P450 2D14-like [Varanus komodoensis]